MMSPRITATRFRLSLMRSSQFQDGASLGTHQQKPQPRTGTIFSQLITAATQLRATERKENRTNVLQSFDKSILLMGTGKQFHNTEQMFAHWQGVGGCPRVSHRLPHRRPAPIYTQGIFQKAGKAGNGKKKKHKIRNE
jgi:hypothetical protein